MNWPAFAEAAPELARLGEERFERTGLVLVGTLRKDGSPRITPVEPMLAHGELFLGMMWQSRKALDLVRDPRCTVHSTTSNRNGTEGDFSVLGRAVDVQDRATRERFADAVFEKIGWRPPEPYHLFAIDIQRALYVVFEGGEKRVQRWRAR